MQTNSFLGIWTDHSIAHLIEYNDDAIYQTIHSEFTHQKKADALEHSESGMHRKENQEQEQFYKKIGTEVLKFEKVLLFGPTNAKLELYNYLLRKPHFNSIKFYLRATDKMTPNEKIAFVRKHFKKALK